MKGFIYTLLILSAIVFFYRSHIGFPDLATSFGELQATYDSQTLHTPLGNFSASGEAQRFEAAAGTPAATSSGMQNAPQRGYQAN
jgi:hypothetical protein